MLKVAVLVSGGGTNLQALIDASARGEIPHADISLVVSNKAGAYALERARRASIETLVIESKGEAFERECIEALTERGIEVIVLAGFMRILSADFISRYRDRIINVHPSLIPSFCGDGYYGLRVHEAALGYGVKVSGATVHFVNEITDGGRIIMQRAVEIREDDTPETLQKRIMEEAEWNILPLSLEKVCKDLALKV